MQLSFSVEARDTRPVEVRVRVLPMCQRSRRGLDIFLWCPGLGVSRDMQPQEPQCLRKTRLQVLLLRFYLKPGMYRHNGANSLLRVLPLSRSLPVSFSAGCSHRDLCQPEQRWYSLEGSTFYSRVISGAVCSEYLFCRYMDECRTNLRFVLCSGGYFPARRVPILLRGGFQNASDRVVYFACSACSACFKRLWSRSGSSNGKYSSIQRSPNFAPSSTNSLIPLTSDARRACVYP